MIEDPENFDILTDVIEKNIRQSLCDSCDKKQSTEFGDICICCACPIEYVISFKFKQCPLEKWSIS